MLDRKKADLITIGQWIESKICFGTFEEPYTLNSKYKEIGDKFVRYVKMVEDNLKSLPKGELKEYEVHAVMKHLVTYRLTPYAIAFAYNELELSAMKDDDIKNNRFTKSVMYLSDRALCNFHITMQPPSHFKNVSMHIRDYFEYYPNEKFAVELDGLESLEYGAGRSIVNVALSILENVPILLQAGFLHYGDYECNENLNRIEGLVKFYESLGFKDVNHYFGCYDESVVMIAHEDKIKEENIELE